jgi:mRNA interferase HigB
MKVHLIRKETIEDYAKANARSRTSFEDWLEKIKYAEWEQPHDIKRTFNSADMLGNGSNRVVFDIAGNNNRMICKYAFGEKQVHLFICWIGSHATYKKLCGANGQYTVSSY